MIPKKIFELYPCFKDIPKEDLETMKESEKNLVITDGKNQKVSKREFKKNYPLEYYWWLNRATFHFTSARDINWKTYYFKNDYLFLPF